MLRPTTSLTRFYHRYFSKYLVSLTEHRRYDDFPTFFENSVTDAHLPLLTLSRDEAIFNSLFPNLTLGIHVNRLECNLGLAKLSRSK